MNEELANRLDGSLGFAVSYSKRIPKPVDDDPRYINDRSRQLDDS